MGNRELRTFCDQRMMALDNERYTWMTHWKELADYILPRRYKWLITPNQWNRGSPINQYILDSTGTIAVRTLASGMMSGITSPTRPWFKLKIKGYEVDGSNPVAIWLAEVERRMMHVFQESNFYNAMATMYVDLIVFGTAAVIIYEDFDDVIRCYNPCAGEYYALSSSRLTDNGLYRKFTLTMDQTVEQFGLENCSQSVKAAWNSKGNSTTTREIVIAHAIEKNDPVLGSVPRKFPYRETYWEWGQPKDTCLQEKGYFDFPAIIPRWDVVSNDAYGRGPGMDALGDIKQLQQETKRKAQALDKLVNPPMLADIELKNQPASLLPGGVTYSAKAQGVGFKPVYQVNPPVREISEDIKEVQDRIRRIFFNDLFMMFQELQAEPRSAAAVDARREEKLVMLGPVLERLQNEGLDPAIDRTFNIMLRGGLLPPAPREIAGAPIEINYISMLAEAQKAVSTGGIERLFAQVGSIAAVDPTIVDTINWDKAAQKYGSLLGVDPEIINTDEQIGAIRKARADQQNAQQAIDVSLAGVKGAKTLSETDVGGGKNALQGMLQ